jgi:hypothetical protein
MREVRESEDDRSTMDSGGARSKFVRRRPLMVIVAALGAALAAAFVVVIASRGSAVSPGRVSGATATHGVGLVRPKAPLAQVNAAKVRPTRVTALQAPLASVSAPIVPPSNPAVSQYVEVIPTAFGGASSMSIVRQVGHQSRLATALPPSTRRAFVADGPDGVTAAVLADVTAPAGMLRGSQADRTRSNATAAGSPRGRNGTSGSAQVLETLTGSATPGGLGVMLPGILTVIVLVATVETIAERRRRARIRR